MRGLLKRRAQAESMPAPAATPTPASCGLLACPHCGLQLETLAFRCPRCLGHLPLGCSGNCRACGKART